MAGALTMGEDGWRARDTTPSGIQAAPWVPLSHRFNEDESFVPARVMNLAVIVDRQFRGEIDNRMARVGRYHTSRLELVAVERAPQQIAAWVTVAAEDTKHAPGHIAVGRERIEVDVGPQ